jgi:hypothetical protein
MFCMGCGAEIRPHADVCPVCGRKLSDPSGAALRPAARAPVLPAHELAAPAPVDTAPRAAAPRASYLELPPPAASAMAPSIGYGDTELLAIPRDTPGRLVIVLALLLAADLFAPWAVFDGTHVAPAHFSVPMVLAVGLLVAAAVSVIYAPFRQRAYYAAYPVVLGAAAFGAAATLTLMLGPLASPLTATFVAHVLAAPVVAQNLANPTPMTSPPTLALAADTGLYVFLLGSASLTVAGYQLFINAVTAAAAPVARVPYPLGQVAPVAAGAVANAPGALPAASRAADVTAGAPAPQWGPAHAASAPAASQVAAGAVPSAAGNGQGGVILPGTEGWNRVPEAPAVGRNAPPMPGLRSGPRTRPR